MQGTIALQLHHNAIIEHCNNNLTIKPKMKRPLKFVIVETHSKIRFKNSANPHKY